MKNPLDSTQPRVFAPSRWPAAALWQRVGAAAAVLSLLGLATPNPMLTLLALAVLAVMGPLLWRAGEFPLMAWLAFLQWLEAAVPVLLANLAGEELGAAGNLVERETAAALGLLGVVVLALGMRLGLSWGPQGRSDLLHDLSSATSSLSARALTYWYGGGLLLGIFADSFIWLIPGTRQLLLPLVEIRWVVIVLIVWGSVWQPSLRRLAYLVILLEVIIGFGGFFSGFKQVLLMGILTLLWAACYTNHRRLRSSIIGLMSIGLILVTFWQAVKGDYREFVNQGSSAQIVLVSPLERAIFLIDQASQVSLSDLTRGLGSGLERAGYVEYFALSINQVPATIPYQQGRLWGEAIDHVLRPRLFFPDKELIHDSLRVREFTGQWVSGPESGTSINIGYFGESYIDFGPVGMFVPILLVGLGYGLAYQLLVHLAPNGLLGTAVAVAALFGTYGGSNIKLLGGTLTSLIVYGLLLRLAGRRLWGGLNSRARSVPALSRQ